jgi:hypothetical protein
MKTAKSILAVLLIAIAGTNLTAEEESTREELSHKGFKAMLGSGSVNMTTERGLQEGESGMLGVGYGFTDRSSLWFHLFGSEHTTSESPHFTREFGGLELSLQHRFDNDGKFLPYGRVGFGLYALQEEDADAGLVGAGVVIGIGADYFFTKHFGVGAELVYRKLDYFKEVVETPAGDVLHDISPNLNGDAIGVMLSIMLQ